TRKLIDLLAARLPKSAAQERRPAQASSPPAARGPELSREDAQLLRARTAGLWLDAGDEPEAFSLIEEMLPIGETRPEAFGLLEGIVVTASTDGSAASAPYSDTDAWELPPEKRRLPVPLLRRAAGLLKDSYTAARRTRERLGVLTVELDIADGD